jgi:DNA-binding transcriptional LysR family regulator
MIDSDMEPIGPDVRSLSLFADVVKTRSFTRTAERHGVTKSAVSKQIASLESELGVQLFVRTTRKLSLTDVGERVHAHCLRIAEELDALHEAAHSTSRDVAGHLRIAAPAALGRTYLMQLLAEFLALHPKLSAEVFPSDAFVDLVAERIDVALRVGRVSETSLVTRKLARVPILLCAAPSYLAKTSPPRAPRHLDQHSFILHGGMDAARLTLKRGARSELVTGRGRLSCADGPAAMTAAEAGFGIFVGPLFEIGEALREGRLVQVLPEWSLDELTLQVVYPPRKHAPRRVREWVDFVALRWKTPPWRLPSS